MAEKNPKGAQCPDINVDFSASVGVSGAMLRLRASGRLGVVGPLVKKYARLECDWAKIETRLCQCNDPAWLLDFAGRCAQRRKNFQSELTSLTERLQIRKKVLEEKLAVVRKCLSTEEPELGEPSHTLAIPLSFLQLMGQRHSQAGRTSDAAARNEIIAKNSELPTKAICEILDVEFPHTDVPTPKLPASWVRQGVKTFADGYRKFPDRVHRVVAEGRRLGALQ